VGNPEVKSMLSQVCFALGFVPFVHAAILPQTTENGCDRVYARSAEATDTAKRLYSEWLWIPRSLFR
jgi:hypothetical protein